MYSFHLINKEKYSQLDCLCLFEEDGRKTYAYINFDECLLKFAYSSEFVNPIIYELNDGIIVIGIDFDICIFSKITQTVVLHIQPDCYFCEFLSVKGKLIAFTQLDVYLINLQNYEVEFEFHYPDIYVSYEFSNNELRMKYLEGGEVTIDLSKHFKSQ